MAATTAPVWVDNDSEPAILFSGTQHGNVKLNVNITHDGTHWEPSPDGMSTHGAHSTDVVVDLYTATAFKGHTDNAWVGEPNVGTQRRIEADVTIAGRKITGTLTMKDTSGAVVTTESVNYTWGNSYLP